jgi:hypothetical protein
MGADIVGWRDCSLQQREGEDGFFRKLKLVAYQREAERRVPDSARRMTLSLKVVTSGQPAQTLSYPALVTAIGDFASGIPECESCPLAERQPLGCYRYLSFPIPAEIEESLASFGQAQLAQGDCALCVLVDRYLQNAQIRELSDGFRHSRGEAVGHIAARPAPLALNVDALSLDSADLLTVLIPPFRDGDELALEAEVLEAWLATLPPGRAGERPWAEWSALARLMREAAELARSMPAVAVLFDA